MDSLSATRIPSTAANSASAATPTAGAQTAWFQRMNGLGEKMAQAFGDATPKGNLMDGMIRMVKPDHLSPQERNARIGAAYDGLSNQKPGQTNQQAAGMQVDEARRLRDWACREGGDKETCRRADHVTRMVTDYRPGQDAQPVSTPPKPPVANQSGRAFTTSELPGCVMTVRAQNPNATKEEMRQAIMDGCAH